MSNSDDTLPSTANALGRLTALAARLQGLPALLFQRQDMASEAGRARERQRRVALTSLSSLLAKLITVTTSLISVPLTLHYLGPERYGLWMAMSSLIAMLSFADLGIGNGLLSSIASAYGRDDRRTIRTLVSSAYAILCTIAFVVVALFACLYLLVDWAALFNVKTPEAVREAGPAMAALVGCFAVAMPLGVVQRTQMALQRGFMANLWQCFDSLVGLAAVLTAIHFKAPLPVLVLSFAGAPQLANVLNSVLFFGRLQPDFAPDPRLASWTLIQSITGTGMLFLVLQVVGSVTFASDGIIIAQTLGAGAVADYAVPQKMFGVIGTMLAIVLAPLWPAYSEAIARGDRAWVLRTLKRSTVLSMGTAAVITFPLVAFGPQIITLWIGTAVTPSMTLLAAFAIWKIVEATGLPIAMYLNGAHIVRIQVITGTIVGLISLALKIYLAPWLGIAGMPISTTIVFILFSLSPTIVLRKRLGLTM